MGTLRLSWADLWTVWRYVVRVKYEVAGLNGLPRTPNVAARGDGGYTPNGGARGDGGLAGSRIVAQAQAGEGYTNRKGFGGNKLTLQELDGLWTTSS